MCDWKELFEDSPPCGSEIQTYFFRVELKKIKNESRGVYLDYDDAYLSFCEIHALDFRNRSISKVSHEISKEEFNAAKMLEE